MEVKEAIEKRRAYRALGPAAIDGGTVRELAGAARLMPSCFNNQPARLVFARSPEALEKMRGCLAKGNEWAHKASMFVALCARKDYDCVIKDREFYLFDLGLAAAAVMLRATELGLVAHPIAGFDPAGVRAAIGIPADCAVLSLLVVGAKSEDLSALNDHQKAAEAERPARLPLESICAEDSWKPALDARPQR